MKQIEKQIFFGILLILCLPSLLLASNSRLTVGFRHREESKFSRYSAKDFAIYKKTVDMCNSGLGFTSLNGLEYQADLFQNAMSESGIITTAINLIKSDYSKVLNNVRVSTGLKEILNSDGFEDALNICFDYPYEKNLFMLSMISADIAGKSSSFLSDITLVRGVFWGLKAAMVVRGAEMPMYGKWFLEMLSNSYKQGVFKSKIGSVSISYLSRFGLTKGFIKTLEFQPLLLTPLRYLMVTSVAQTLFDIRKMMKQQEDQLEQKSKSSSSTVINQMLSPVEEQIKRIEKSNDALKLELMSAKTQQDKDFLEYLIQDNLRLISDLNKKIKNGSK